MTYELKQIIEAGLAAKENGLKSVLATVVALDGSSYRKPGVRMLIREDGQMIGAVSGGCVEKDIQRHAQSVFKTKETKMMTYDGRYRLGCEGVLYILIELFEPDDLGIEAFYQNLEERIPFQMQAHYVKGEGIFNGMGTVMSIQGQNYKLSKSRGSTHEQVLVFFETIPPCFKLLIFGAEHDAVQLCQMAHYNGWEVSIIAGPLESKTITDFPGATGFYNAVLESDALQKIDGETAVMIMSHNFANDLKFLLDLKNSAPAYIGLLGPSKRREKLLAELMEYAPDLELSFLDRLYGPAGLNIGAETPQEIAISIIAEILSVIREQSPMSLKEKRSSIHAKIEQ